jgi:hypothetical protein
MTQNFIGKLSYCIFEELVNQKKNKPTDGTLYLYLYYTFIYNLSTIISGLKPNLDNITKPIWYNKLQKHARFNTDNMLNNLVFYGSQSMLNKMFKTHILQDKDIELDFNITKNPHVLCFINDIQTWANEHFESRQDMIDENPFESKTIDFKNGFKVDLNQWNNNLPDPTKWIELITPTGKVTDPIIINGKTINIPKIDETDSTSYSTQNYLGDNWHNHKSFSLDLKNNFNIINVLDQVPSTEEELKKEMDDLLKIYETLDDTQKVTADLFAGSGSTNLPPPCQMLIVANMLSQKYNQSHIDEITMYFVLICGLFDASVAAWWYKHNTYQARPISLIRHYYKDVTIKSWTPFKGIQNIKGSEWLPHQVITFNTPPFPDMASGHSVFSTTSGELLKWWFNSDILYDGVSMANVINSNVWTDILDQSQKQFLIGEFVIKVGKSEIESGVTPVKDIRLIYPTITSFYQACGISRVYGGIHSESTNQLSQIIGKSVYEKTKEKLLTLGITNNKKKNKNPCSYQLHNSLFRKIFL